MAFLSSSARRTARFAAAPAVRSALAAAAPFSSAAAGGFLRRAPGSFPAAAAAPAAPVLTGARPFSSEEGTTPPPTGLPKHLEALAEFFDPGGTVKTPFPNPEVEHGRAWSAAELRRKSFDDLVKLWHVLYKERNVLLTEQGRARRFRRRMRAPIRRWMVRKSMSRIKFILSERRIAYKAARLASAQAALDIPEEER